MSEPTPDAADPTGDGGTIADARDERVRGLVEAARLWARQHGLPVPEHGPVPDEVVAQYRRRQVAD